MAKKERKRILWLLFLNPSGANLLARFRLFELLPKYRAKSRNSLNFQGFFAGMNSLARTAG